MSQAKVDKRKYEKKNRKKLEKQRKIRFAVKCIATALVVGAIIGIPTGIKIYKNIPKFVGDSTLEAFVGTYIDENHAADIPDFASSTDSDEEDSSKDEAADEDTDVESTEESAGDTSEESTEE